MKKADLICEMVGLLEDAITYYEHDNAKLFLLYYGRAQSIEWLLMDHFDWYSEDEGGYPMDLLDTCFTYCSRVNATKED